MIRIRTSYNDIHVSIYPSDVHNPGTVEPIEIRSELTVTDAETVITIPNLFVYDFRNNLMTSQEEVHFIILDWYFVKLSEKEMLLHINYLKEVGDDTYNSFDLFGRILFVRKSHFLNLPYYELPLLSRLKFRK